MTDIIIDFETRSRCDLKAAGTYMYGTDPSTEIICMAAVMVDDDRAWLLHKDAMVLGKNTVLDLAELLTEADRVIAHNAIFDQLIYECIAVDMGWPEIPPEKWFCSSAQARVNAMPAGLDGLSHALDATHKKDHRGAQLIRQVCIPDKKTGEFNKNPKLIKELGEYCLNDVLATKASLEKLREMTQVEYDDYRVNERINERGVKIDRELAMAAMKYADAEQKEIGAELSDLTDGEVTKHTQTARIRDWVIWACEDDGCDEVIEHMVVYKKGEKKHSLDKAIRSLILGGADTGLLTVPDDVYDVIAELHEGNKSSVAKFRRMIDMADPETDRVHGAFLYAGASQTIRFSSRGLQLHNFRRDCFSPKDAEYIKDLMINGARIDNIKILNSGDDKGRIAHGTTKAPNTTLLGVMDVLSRMLRPALIPDDGNIFIVGDWSSIEACALPWLSDDPRAEDRLDVFRRGEDIYEMTAKQVGLPSRQGGKVVELSMGYSGAEGALSAMARSLGFTLPPLHKVKAIVKRWRRGNPWAEDFWNGLHDAAMKAVKNPGQEFTAGKVKYLFIPDLIDGTLMCLLPGDFSIQYPKAKIEIVKTPWGTRPALTALKANWKPKADAKEWPRVVLWRGLLVENVTQAFCARLLRHVLIQLPDAVAHIHDEPVLEVPEQRKVGAAIMFKRIMNTVPDWAEGLPMSADVKYMRRYGK